MLPTMSHPGIKRFADAMLELQLAKDVLIRMGSANASTKSGQQDIRLGQLCDTAKDAVKEEFAKITTEDNG